MPHDDVISPDGGSPKYLPGFRDSVRDMKRHPGSWSVPYGVTGERDLAVAKAYQQGRLDAVTWMLGHCAAPGALLSPEEPRMSPEAVWEALGLFTAVAEPAGTIAEALATRPDLPAIDGDPVVWAVRSARSVLSLSLAEGTDYVKELLGD